MQSRFEWKQPSAFARTFELRSDDSLVATLHFPKTFGTLAEAVWGEHQWTFKRQGFLRPRITARLSGSEQELALYEPNWTGAKGVLHGPGTRIFLWESVNLFGSEHRWRCAESGPLLHFTQKGVLRSGAEVDVTDAGQREEHLNLLVLLGWYLVLMAQEEASAAVVAIG